MAYFVLKGLLKTEALWVLLPVLWNQNLQYEVFNSQKVFGAPQQYHIKINEAGQIHCCCCCFFVVVVCCATRRTTTNNDFKLMMLASASYAGKAFGSSQIQHIILFRIRGVPCRNEQIIEKNIFLFFIYHSSFQSSFFFTKKMEMSLRECLPLL